MISHCCKEFHDGWVQLWFGMVCALHISKYVMTYFVVAQPLVLVVISDVLVGANGQERETEIH